MGAPAPRDIAEAAYGRRLDDKLSKATVERLLPCIIDGSQLPRDLVETTTRRARNRVGFKEHLEWEKCLGIACALFRGHNKQRNYQMALEQDRITRDYLYGRLLAVAENIESQALFVAGEKRDTMAARLMQRFADRPYST
ncbi:type I-C CRISPR-associated protein Cas8c/Csd1, partial [Aeromonas caviae]|uniref:type I-C CRISPR-associated protein Cas8c/Csd1 n=1 Tax=Aeromonas caviae TaxID=648 RepID=UPI00338FBA87